VRSDFVPPPARLADELGGTGRCGLTDHEEGRLCRKPGRAHREPWASRTGWGPFVERQRDGGTIRSALDSEPLSGRNAERASPWVAALRYVRRAPSAPFGYPADVSRRESARTKRLRESNHDFEARRDAARRTNRWPLSESQIHTRTCSIPRSQKSGTSMRVAALESNNQLRACNRRAAPRARACANRRRAGGRARRARRCGAT